MNKKISFDSTLLSAEEQKLIQARANKVDYASREKLHYLGNYVRTIPVNLKRMMENAHDWEHLPFVHSSSFAGIDCLDQGPWGWRARLYLPEDKGGGSQLLDLIVDNDRHYWVSTVFFGLGEGVQIHTQASQHDVDNIKVDVRFYLPDAPVSDEMAVMILGYMQTQYATLYDEDEALMQGRQAAIDHRRSQERQKTDRVELKVGSVDALDQAQPYILDTPNGRVVVRCYNGKWMGHDAVCPHMLGPLDGDCMDSNGILSCPWHGYRFDINTGQNLDGKCGDLRQVWRAQVKNSDLWISPEV